MVAIGVNMELLNVNAPNPLGFSGGEVMCKVYMLLLYQKKSYICYLGLIVYYK